MRDDRDLNFHQQIMAIVCNRKGNFFLMNLRQSLKLLWKRYRQSFTFCICTAFLIIENASPGLEINDWGLIVWLFWFSAFLLSVLIESESVENLKVNDRRNLRGSIFVQLHSLRNYLRSSKKFFLMSDKDIMDSSLRSIAMISLLVLKKNCSVSSQKAMIFSYIFLKKWNILISRPTMHAT